MNTLPLVVTSLSRSGSIISNTYDAPCIAFLRNHSYWQEGFALDLRLLKNCVLDQHSRRMCTYPVRSPRL